MKYFYDLEFNDLGYGEIDFISIGMVCEDGREYYAVNSAISTVRIEGNQWIMDNVWPYILRTPQKNIKPLITIAAEIEDFIGVGINGEGGDKRSGNELWAYYGAYDHVVMCRSLWGRMNLLPNHIPMWTHELMQLWEWAGKPEKPEQKEEHHALHDARWNFELYKKCVEIL